MTPPWIGFVIRPMKFFAVELNESRKIRRLRLKRSDGDFAIRICGEALGIVQSVRRTFADRPVTADEIFAALDSETYWQWTRPAHREALRVILEAQAPDGYSVPWIVKRPEAER